MSNLVRIIDRVRFDFLFLFIANIFHYVLIIATKIVSQKYFCPSDCLNLSVILSVKNQPTLNLTHRLENPPERKITTCIQFVWLLFPGGYHPIFVVIKMTVVVQQKSFKMFLESNPIMYCTRVSRWDLLNEIAYYFISICRNFFFFLCLRLFKIFVSLNDYELYYEI